MYLYYKVYSIQYLTWYTVLLVRILVLPGTHSYYAYWVPYLFVLRGENLASNHHHRPQCHRRLACTVG
jgi:hypothetical protein